MVILTGANRNDVARFTHWVTLSRPLLASAAGRFRSPALFRATEATTTANIAVRYMQLALQPKSPAEAKPH
ncbi:hypothetical protein OKW35_005219 [Paraburkholderia sp. MM5477-R1]